MEEENNLISLYGLEFPSRAVTAQVAETDVVRFLVGTQTLKLSSNQVHLVELNDDTGVINTKVYQHGDGEVWSITASPSDPAVLATCLGTGEDSMQTKLWRLPEEEGDNGEQPKALQLITRFNTEPHGQNIKVTAFNPLDGKQAVTVVDNKFVEWDLGESEAKLVSAVTVQSKGNARLSIGKWNPQHSGLQFVTASDCCVRGWDLRAGSKQAWSIESAHSQLVRDFDFNPNRQYYVGTCGDDGCSKFWDSRKPTEPVLSRADHSHWVWCLRYNQFHDQLVVTSSSDCTVLLTSIASLASEALPLEDGVLCAYSQHEDSVYCVEWSAADPWCFASLSYDGRLLLNRVLLSWLLSIKQSLLCSLTLCGPTDDISSIFPGEVVCEEDRLTIYRPLKWVRRRPPDDISSTRYRGLYIFINTLDGSYYYSFSLYGCLLLLGSMFELWF